MLRLLLLTILPYHIQPSYCPSQNFRRSLRLPLRRRVLRALRSGESSRPRGAGSLDGFDDLPGDALVCDVRDVLRIMPVWDNDSLSKQRSINSLIHQTYHLFVCVGRGKWGDVPRIRFQSIRLLPCIRKIRKDHIRRVRFAYDPQ